MYQDGQKWFQCTTISLPLLRSFQFVCITFCMTRYVPLCCMTYELVNTYVLSKSGNWFSSPNAFILSRKDLFGPDLSPGPFAFKGHLSCSSVDCQLGILKSDSELVQTHVFPFGIFIVQQIYFRFHTHLKFIMRQYTIQTFLKSFPFYLKNSKYNENWSQNGHFRHIWMPTNPKESE